MRSSASGTRVSVAEYFRIENGAEEKHEYRDGEMFVTGGGSDSHSLISVNVAGELGMALKRTPFQVHGSNLRIGMPGARLYTYADASVIFGKPEFVPEDMVRGTVMNPRLLVEVLAPSTEGYDQGEKFWRYRTIESLEEYVLISERVAQVDIFRRKADGTWVFSSVAGLEGCVRLASVQVEVPMAEIYARVEFPPVEAAAS